MTTGGFNRNNELSHWPKKKRKTQMALPDRFWSYAYNGMELKVSVSLDVCNEV